MEGVAEMFAEFAMDAVDDYQLDLFTHYLRDQFRRKEAHRERQRIAQRIQPTDVRKATNVSRRDYWRTYRTEKRREAGVQPKKRTTPEQRREYRRQWMANWRAEQRAA